MNWLQQLFGGQQSAGGPNGMGVRAPGPGGMDEMAPQAPGMGAMFQGGMESQPLMGLLGAGLGMLGASSPRPGGASFGEALGGGMGGLLNGMMMANSAKQNRLADERFAGLLGGFGQAAGQLGAPPVMGNSPGAPVTPAPAAPPGVMPPPASAAGPRPLPTMTNPQPRAGGGYSMSGMSGPPNPFAWGNVSMRPGRPGSWLGPQARGF